MISLSMRLILIFVAPIVHQLTHASQQTTATFSIKNAIAFHPFLYLGLLVNMETKDWC
jgi:prepilin signal peptidase PulO-like enzyme (type II secretory pathway)